MSSGHSALICVQKSPLASAPPLAAALPLAAAPLLVAADVAAADVELLLLVVLLLLHADSTSATALMPAMVAVNFFAGL
jgi:hypothetical protein